MQTKHKHFVPAKLVLTTVIASSLSCVQTIPKPI